MALSRLAPSAKSASGGRAGGRPKNSKRTGVADLSPLQRNDHESNYIFWREIASLTFSIFDEYSALLIVAYFANRKSMSQHVCIIMFIIIN